MCVGFWCLDDPEYSLVLCTNRDEDLSRPTKPAHWHSFETLKSPAFSEQHDQVIGEASVLSGIDLLAGGTWVGINNQGEVALLTNITEPPVKFSSSRGDLCSSFLRRSPSSDIDDFVADITSSQARYAGFNLLLLAPKRSSPTNIPGGLHYDARFLSNGGAGNPIVSVSIQQTFGCEGISNGVPTGSPDPFTGEQRTSEWPKVVQGREMLSDILAMHANEDALVEQLFGLLGNRTHSPPATLKEFQETIMVDPVNLAAVRSGPSFSKTHSGDNVSPATNNDGRRSNIAESGETPNYYATRLSTVLLVRRTGEVLFIEKNQWQLDKDAKPELGQKQDGFHERRIRFQLQ